MLSEWSEFFVATAGACAALAGLIIVAISVSVNEMITIPAMASRAGVAIALLVLATVVALAGLIPELSIGTFGVIVLVLGAISCVFACQSLVRLIRTRNESAGDSGREEHRSLGEVTVKGLMGVVPAALIAVGGLVLALGIAGGLLWVAAGLLGGICFAVLEAWVIMVEIRR